TEVLEHYAVPRATASEQARHLLEGDLRGHPSHGLRRLDIIVQRLDAGLIIPDASPQSTWGALATLSVDAKQCWGPPAAQWTVHKLQRRPAKSGIAVASMRGANHLGILAPYVERI